MRTLFVFLLLAAFPATAQVRDLADTDQVAYNLIRAQEEWARLHKERDPVHVANLAKIPADFVFVQYGRSRTPQQLVRDNIGTYYDSYQFSGFRVEFASATEAVVTYRSVIAMRGFGKRAIASTYATKIIKKIDDQWTVVSTVLTTAK